MSRATEDDTIVAIATAPGRGALAVIRVSGPRALDIGRRMIEPFPAAPRRATLARVLDAEGRVADEAIVVYQQGPASFTGEDVVEVTCHGGAVTPASIAASFASRGARPAEPGEFTRRAVLNGKLDLIQAEAIGDLVDAATRPAQRAALSQLDGGLSRRIVALRDRVIHLEALCAYDIDFPEEDDGPIPAARILDAAESTLADVEALLATAPVGEVVRAGAVVVIAGAPNVGKSSLFNALLGRRRAIVTDVPGTTRDALEAVTEADGWPIRLVDTAGLRETSEVVERMGIEMSREYAERADVVLVCGDSASSLRDARDAVRTVTAAPVVEVRTKADLEVNGATRPADGTIWVSAASADGLDALARRIAETLANAKGALALDAPLVTRERQRYALERAREELRQFRQAWQERSVPAVVSAVHLREAARELEEMIGTIDVEEVLDRVFRTFCVGK
ncbi:MAG: tRNA uridine-5-carboxymethylaminomethyl(34) synthesis GTPase MnmE [Gemmatimonadaceae bacterium]